MQKSENETIEIQKKRKHENKVNEKVQDMYTTSPWKTYPHEKWLQPDYM